MRALLIARVAPGSNGLTPCAPAPTLSQTPVVSSSWAAAGPFASEPPATRRLSVLAQLPEPQLPDDLIGRPLNLTDPKVALVNSPSGLVIAPRALLPGAFYAFSFSVVLQAAPGGGGGSGGLSSRSVVVHTQPVPRGEGGAAAGGVTVDPPSGVGLDTVFTVTPVGWVTPGSADPVRFRTGYQAVGSPLPAIFVTEAPFTADQPAALPLPPGNAAFGSLVTVLLVAETATGAQSFAFAAANVTVIARGSVEMAASLADSLGKSTADPLTVVYDAQAVGTLLNEVEAVGAAQTRTAEDTRLKLLAAVNAKTGTAAAKTAAGVTAVASAVATIVTDPAQLSAAAKASALATLSAVSGAGTAVTPAAAKSVALALSSLAANQTSVSSDVLQGVLSVLATLSRSQARQLSGLGEPPLVVSTPDIQIATAVNPVSADSPLFQRPITAGDSRSSFNPMPPTALSKVKSSTVTSSFMALSFDPHAKSSSQPNAATGSMARLALLGDDGRELKIGNLSQPVTFVVPAVNGSDGSSVGCSFWDEEAQEYSAQGCVGAPNPRPLFHNVAWNTSLNFTSDVMLAIAWEIQNASTLNLVRPAGWRGGGALCPHTSRARWRPVRACP